MKTLKVTLPINLWATDDQPRTKLMNKGSESLSNAELLSILIGSGNRNENAVELCRRLLISCDNKLSNLAKLELSDIETFEGISTAKAVAILSALELGKRRQEENFNPCSKISCPMDVYRIFHPILCDKNYEEFWVLYLNQSGHIIKKMRISTGGIDGTYADIRIILREALLCRSTQMAVVHNHPSGNTRPSSQDIRLTASIREGAKTMNIRLFDHVIITDGKYYSFSEEGTL